MSVGAGAPGTRRPWRPAQLSTGWRRHLPTRRLSLALLILVSLPGIVTAQSPQPSFDLKSPDIIAGGRILFNQRCAGRCHGLDGREGFDGPILAGKAYLDPSYVWATLVTGRPGSAMPAWNGRLTDDEMWKIIAFVSSLADQARGRPPAPSW